VTLTLTLSDQTNGNY